MAITSFTSAPLAVVFLDGEYEDAGFYAAWAAHADIVVAADGAAAFLAAQDLPMDVVVGDFDSLTRERLTTLTERGVAVKRYPTRKDETDGELAVAEALERGAAEVVLAGALGALDHTLGHLAILRRLAAQGVTASLVAPELTVRVLVAPAHHLLRVAPSTRVSVVALAADAVVTLQGMEYPLERELLRCDACRGLGNAVSAATPLVQVHEGTVAVLVAARTEPHDTEELAGT